MESCHKTINESIMKRDAEKRRTVQVERVNTGRKGSCSWFHVAMILRWLLKKELYCDSNEIDKEPEGERERSLKRGQHL